jgi:hypothetical protein
MPEPRDWSNLAQVIQYAESLGAGKTVYKLSGSPIYHVCDSAAVKFNKSLTGRMQLSSNLLGRPEKRFVIFRTKERS